MNSKMRFFLMGVLVIVMVISAACGPAATPVPPPATAAPATAAPATAAPATAAPATAAPATAAPAAEPITLQFLSTSDPAIIPAYPALFAAFQKSEGGKWANVTIQVQAVPYPELFTKIQTSIATKAPLDLVFADAPFIANFGYNNALKDLTPYIDAEYLKQFLPATNAQNTYKGKLLALPLQQSCSMMFYNKDITDAAGIKPPADLASSWTMDQALDAWTKTTTPDVAGLRWGQGNFFIDYDQNNFKRSAGAKGSPTFDGVSPDGLTWTGYFNTPEAVAAMVYYQNMAKKNILRAEPLPDEWYIGKAAFLVAPENTIGTIPSAAPDPSKFHWGVTGIPYFKQQLCQTGSFNWAISPNTTHFDAALAFIKFAAGAEGAKIMYDTIQQLPANITVLAGLPEYGTYPKKIFADGFAQVGVTREYTPCYPEYQTQFVQMMQTILSGADVKKTLDQTASDLDGLCAKYK